MSGKLYPVAKLLEAGGIAAVMLGLVQGIYGDMWGELYLFLGGILVFLIGRQMEKRVVRGAGTPEKAG
ncbi:MAG TPA: hypothetical protein VI215_01850 [Bacteroidota bacterium]|jgi:hypothetical protein